MNPIRQVIIASRGFRFCGLACPSATSDLVDWSTANWWHPTPVEDIEWDEFRDAVDLTPEDVESTGYLPWKEGWEDFEEFVARNKADYSEGFYKGDLPSGEPFYVWVASGIEHWWTQGATGIDVDREQQIITFVEERLEDEDNVTLRDVMKVTKEARKMVR